ncbi:MAG TPA: GIDE domain-containing protein [Acidiferrobacterales bacterium]|nr:GIDE domain-containing protein [Acidiferrobacterales bacterium]
MAQPGAFHARLIEFSQSVHSADPLAITGVIAVLALVAVVAAWRAQRSLKEARLIEDTPTSKARSAAQGYVALEGVGKQMDGPPIIAPLSGTSCVWYRYLIEEQVTTYNKGRNETRWATVDKGESTEVFWLEDETGRIAVDPEGAEVTPKHKEVWRSRSGASSYSTLPGFIANFVSSSASSNPHRFTEELIHKGERIYALGLLKNVGSHINAPLHEEIGFLLNQWKQDQAALKRRFDLNQDGEIDEKEWMLARAEAYREVTKTQREEQQQSVEPINLLGPTHDPGRPYLLSAFPEEGLIKHYRRYAVLYLALFFTVGSAAIWFFNTRFGG